jgi:hypothetical protein
MLRERNKLQEAVSNREAQATLVQIRCSRRRKKAVFICLVNRQVRFVQIIQVITSSKKAIGLPFSERLSRDT